MTICKNHSTSSSARSFCLLASRCISVALFASSRTSGLPGLPWRQDHAGSAGHSISVDGDKFSASIHGSLQCNDCHADIKEYPHPDHIAKVDCKTCHADEGSKLTGSVHSSERSIRAPVVTAMRTTFFPRPTRARPSIRSTCRRPAASAIATAPWHKKHGLPSVYPHYMDSIHGFALSKEGLLVAANCQSCHGSHHILSHNDPASPTYKANIPKTCGTCHAKINDDYQGGAHGHAIASGNLKAPVCTDCHTAHAILQPTESAFRMQSTPICGSCHKDKLSTYRDTFHSQLGSLGGYVETARCWDCHGAHEIFPASDPRSPVNKANLVADLRQMPRGCEPQLCSISAARQCARPQAESGALLRAAVYECVAGQRAHVLRDSHTSVADPFAIRPDQEKFGRWRQKCLSSNKHQQKPKCRQRTRRSGRFTPLHAGTALPPCGVVLYAFWAWRARDCRCVSAKASGLAASRARRRLRSDPLLS